MVRGPTTGAPVFGTSPHLAPAEVASPTTPGLRPETPPGVFLHTCGHTCGQPRGAANVGTPAADDLWAKVAAAVRAQLSEATWNTWFQGVHALDLSDDTLILGVPSSVTIERLRTSYLGLLTDAAQALTGFPLDISLLVDTAPRLVELVSIDQLAAPVVHAAPAAHPPPDESHGSPPWMATSSLNPRYTFDQFV